MTIKIEPGKSYRDRTGNRWDYVSAGGSCKYPYVFRLAGTSIEYEFTDAGLLFAYQKEPRDPRDLIAEWTEPEAPPTEKTLHDEFAIERLTKERDEARNRIDAYLRTPWVSRVIAAEAALEKMREAAAIALPILERDRQSLIQCCSSLRKTASGEIEIVPDTLEEGAADDVAAYDDAISRLRDALTTQGGERVALSQFDLEILLRAARQEFLKFSDNAGLAHSEINAARKLADAGLLERFEHELREGPPLPRTAWRITSSGREAARAAIATQGGGE